MATYIVLLGPPGVGKGTQAKVLAKETGLVHVSSGDLFRENIKNQTELGKLAKSHLDKGELVPNDVTIAMIRDRISQPDSEKGAILDGFPRTPKQAEALDTMLQELKGSAVDLTLFINAPEEVLIERASGRWTCQSQGHIYHEKFNPPKQMGTCDVDESELYQRDDDKVETITKRIKVYLEQTAPLVDYYKQMALLREVDGSRTPEEVTKDLLDICKAYLPLQEDEIIPPTP